MLSIVAPQDEEPERQESNYENHDMKQQNHRTITQQFSVGHDIVIGIHGDYIISTGILANDGQKTVIRPAKESFWVQPIISAG